MFFFLHDTAPTELYTLSLHDALPIFGIANVFRGHSPVAGRLVAQSRTREPGGDPIERDGPGDRKSTRLNSSHVSISYAVFCLKKKKKEFICHIRPHAKPRCRCRPLDP